MMKNMLLILMCFLLSCSKYSDDIEHVLQQAGKNRKKLEKVLNHYRKNTADSLKLRAAEFLILNMPGKYSEYYDAPWNDVSTVMLRWTSSPDKQLVLDTYHLGEPVRQDDIEHITANYLINNIELAFKVWREMPWGKDIPFDVFCEEILPYRTSTEPLENWREKVLASFAVFYDEFRDDTTGITPVEACCRVNDQLPRFRMDKDFPPMSYSQLMSSTRGTCDNMTDLAVFVMRGLGIPVSRDFTPIWPGWPIGHTWNSVRDSNGDRISFMGTETKPGDPHQGNTLRKCKVYRYTYAIQSNIVADKDQLPPLLQKINNVVDVTKDYGIGADIHLLAQNSHLNITGYVFLSIPYELKWNPVAWGHSEGDSLHFFSVGKNVLYLPVYYHSGIQTPASDPFFLDENGICRFFCPDSLNKELTSIFSSLDRGWTYRMIGGVFEVANQKDFSDARRIYRIESEPGTFFNTVTLDQPTQKFRYVRYISPPGGRCDISLLDFYDENHNKLQGLAIGESSTGWNNKMTNFEKAFDGDVDTYVESLSDNSWTGLDLGEPKRIAKIRYLPRTFGHCIYEGHVYELFYSYPRRMCFPARLPKRSLVRFVINFPFRNHISIITQRYMKFNNPKGIKQKIILNKKNI